MPWGGSGSTNLVHSGRRQPHRRTHDHEMQRPQSWGRLDPFSSSATQCRSRNEEQRYIASQLRAQFGERFVGPTQSPQHIGSRQGGRSIARASPEASRCRNPLDQMNSNPRLRRHSCLATEQLHGPNHQIRGPRRQIIFPCQVRSQGFCQGRRPRTRNRNQSPSAGEFYLLGIPLDKNQGIVKTDRDDQGFDLVISVVPLSQHFEEQIQLGGRRDNQTSR